MMNARLAAHVLDAVAVRLREGLNSEGCELQEAARILRIVDETDRRTEYNRDNVLAYIDETAKSLRQLAEDIEDVRWEAEFYTAPREIPAPEIAQVDLVPGWAGASAEQEDDHHGIPF